MSLENVTVVDVVKQRQEEKEEKEEAFKRLQEFTEAVANELGIGTGLWRCKFEYYWNGHHLEGGWHLPNGRRFFRTRDLIASFYRSSGWRHEDIMAMLNASPFVINFSVKFRNRLDEFKRAAEKAAQDHKMAVEIRVVEDR